MMVISNDDGVVGSEKHLGLCESVEALNAAQPVSMK